MPRNRKWESELEKAFHKAWKNQTVIPIQTQYRFHPRRRWAFDFAFPDRLLAIEIQGYGKGHASYNDMHGDYRKNNEAILHGWVILYFMSEDLTTTAMTSTINYIVKVLKTRPLVVGQKLQIPPTRLVTKSQSAIDRLLRPFGDDK